MAEAAACANWLLEPTIKLEKLYLGLIELKMGFVYSTFNCGSDCFKAGASSFFSPGQHSASVLN